MSGATPALIAAAAGVGFAHASLPDHWVPLAMVGRTRRYPLSRVARLSLLAGLAHVLTSLLLGGLIIAIGLQFRSAVEGTQNAIIGSVLILTGAAFVILELTGRGHSHDQDARAHGDEREDGRARGNTAARRSHHRERSLVAIMVPFGAAASPDLTILPVFLAATAAGVFAALGALVVFSAVTIGTIVGLTLVACFGGYRVNGHWLDRWGSVFTAAVLVTIGGLVLAGAL
jgi:nickel/cobalt transporter (NicO) family protein